MKKIMTLVLSFLAVLFLLFSNSSIKLNAASLEGEIVDKGDRITWVDASKALPYNYASIIGFEVTFKLLTDRTNYEDGYGGVTEDKNDPYYNMHFPCYILVASMHAHDNTEFNKQTFGADEGEYFEHYTNSELAKQEICKMGVGEGHYVAGYLDNGKGYSEYSKMVAGDVATIKYESTQALFEQGDPIMTFYGYTAAFEIQNISWITGTPVVEEVEDWSVVEKDKYLDIETVENKEDQNGCNYINIIKPKGATNCPVILWVHGGAWSTSSRTDIILNNTMEYFLAKGYAFASAEYTLTRTDGKLTLADITTLSKLDSNTASTMKNVFQTVNDTQGKQMIYDLKLAVRFLRAKGNDYGLDPTYICAMGESAGAHLSLLLATTNGSLEHEGANEVKYGGYSSYSSDVQSAIVYSAPTDLTGSSASFLMDYTDKYPLIASVGEDNMKDTSKMMAYYVLGYHYVEEHTKNGVADNELLEAEKFMSPYWQVTSETVPIYLIHGELDGAVSITQSYAMELEAKMFMDEDNVKATYYKDASHVDKKYFDVFAQYKTSLDLSDTIKEKALENKKPSGKPDINDEPKKGCKGEVTVTTLIGLVSLLGALLLAKKKAA